jgi:hypothetical protein
MSTFGWLHLTDLHLGLKGQHWLLKGVQAHFFDDLKYLHDKCGPWDLVLFSGDLTQSGNKKQFANLDEFLALLWKHLRTLGSDPVLLAVPGNHDLTRPDETWAQQIIEAYGKKPDEFWDDGLPYRKGLKKAFANYQAWWENTPLKGKDKIQSGTLAGDFSWTLQKDGARLGIVGLNTTFLQLVGGDLKGKLAVDPRQFHEACGGSGPAWTQEHHACLLMTHQPPDWLTQQAEEIYKGEIASPPRFAVHLFGHMHEAVLRTESYGGGEARRTWQGNSLFSIESLETPEGKKVDRRHGYSAGRLDIEEDGMARLRHWPRRLRKHPQSGHWEFIPDYESCSLSMKDNLSTSPETVTLLQAAPAVQRPAAEPELTGLGIVKATSSKDERIVDYKKCLLEASGRCFISGTSAIHLAEDSSDVLARKLKEGVKIDLLIMSPDWAQASHRLFAWLSPALQKKFHEEIRNSIDKLREMWRKLSPAARANFRLRAYDTIFPLIITAYEDGAQGRMVAEITDMIDEPTRPRFTLRKKEAGLFLLFQEKYDSLWNNAQLTKDVALASPDDGA